MFLQIQSLAGWQVLSIIVGIFLLLIASMVIYNIRHKKIGDSEKKTTPKKKSIKSFRLIPSRSLSTPKKTTKVTKVEVKDEASNLSEEAYAFEAATNELNREIIALKEKLKISEESRGEIRTQASDANAILNRELANMATKAMDHLNAMVKMQTDLESYKALVIKLTATNESLGERIKEFEKEIVKKEEVK